MKLTATVKTTFWATFLFIFLSVNAFSQSEESTTSNQTPITNFIQFEAIKFGNNIELKWRASSKGLGGDFIVERSKDGVSFKKISTIQISKVAGAFNYVYTDRTPIKEKSFYRIKIAESNSTPKISDVASVDLSGNNTYTAYPTSTKALIFIKIPKETKIAIYNNQGNLVKTVELKESQNIDVSDLNNGYYQIHFEGSKESVRFIKM